MPSLSDFPKSMMAHVVKTVTAANESMASSANFGADYMRRYIEGDSPTGSEWHDMKNSLNGYAMGSRIGGAIYAENGRKVFQPSGHSGQMLKSIEVGRLTSVGTDMSINYGWLQNRQSYFLSQDTGSYIKTAKGRDKRGVGMGLLNTASGGGKETLQKLGAFNETNKFFIKQMQAKGFKVSGTVTND